MPDAIPHPFSRFVAILGRGRTKQRHLTREEAREAMEMILEGRALPEQIGAFLMLLRLKEEAPEEMAGFVDATRATFRLPPAIPPVDVDWSSYAGKRRQLPWFLLSVLTLVGEGVRVFMHGTEGHTPGRLYTREVLAALGIPAAASLEEAARHIEARGFAYVPLEVLSPVLRQLIELRPILGLRSPVHSFTRMLNPFGAPVMMQGIFHRGFMDIHAGAARLLGQPVAAVFRGEGGEIERRPNKPLQVWTTRGAEGPFVEEWPALLDEGHIPADEQMDMGRLAALWRGEEDDEHAAASVIGTLAVTLKAMGRARAIGEAEALARAMWARRDRSRIPAACATGANGVSPVGAML
ncbi:Anthranilate phosphoribosyltransferase [Meinhardsimonia xiamenensis]|jgi:anthranilate phosphoribosyltransferase|uniref:Anthranilate phosphoribosyltransferase n=1 Tax=Meinhardsimonia xiamenensis TaxID=990712 RepID=A0A1G9GEN3_9RHOB|nr:glycosyl transferase family protein [Meinhardsimonia xiamenensis]PRX31946.1 anthranilate phosphoribosyltransferase [Meinhardsimonia xiamenensis]SDK98743.1 Anthranilate phosphoribosyltransferase [Meinhardsimonia xiamenensis]